MSAKILVIGLDGFIAAVLEPLMENHRLPHLARLRADGGYWPLRSTIPANSAPAWTSSRTGVNPGKHGVFSFWHYDAYQWAVAGSTHILVPTIEQILSRRGYRVCAMNIPLSYPPQPVNGAFLSGLPTPPGRRDHIYPRELYHVLKTMGTEFPVDGMGMLNTSSPPALVRQLTGIHERRRRVARYLLAREPWDLFWVVFTLADKLQHLLWEQREQWLADGAPHGDSHLGSPIEGCYQILDETVGMLLQELDERSTVLAISDHGFGPCRAIFQPNLWLRSRDFLQLKTGHKIGVRSLRFTRAPSGLRLRPRLEVGPPHRRIKWGKTRAFSDLYAEPVGIRINLKGREPRGIVARGRDADRLKQTIADELSEMAPSGGVSPPLLRVIPREELYTGPFLELAPDLILESSDSSVRFLGEFTRGDVFSDPGAWPDVTGSHRPIGIVVGRGRNIGSALQSTDRRIEDIPPTILAVLGEPIPRYMEGTPLVG